MGFLAPVFSEPEMPRLLLSFLFLLARLSSWLPRLIGAVVNDALIFNHPTASGIADRRRRQELHHEDHRLEELEKHSPAMRFDALSSAGDGGEALLLLPEGCAVCLGDFHGAARVRRPRGCRHVFHRACLDRWATHGHSTCPLCRAPLLPPFLLPLPLSAS